MTVYRRGSNVFHYRFMLNGKRYRGTTEQTVQSKAELVEARLKTAILTKKKRPATGESLTLSRFAEDFLKWIETARSRKTKAVLDPDSRRYYQSGWRLLRETDLAGMKMVSIDRDTVESQTFPGGSSNGNCALRTLRRMLNRAHESGLIPRPDSFTLMREYKRERVLSKKEEERLLMFAPQPLYDVALCIFDGGMRPEEVFRMDWENFRWDSKEYFVPFGKTPKARRYVPLSSRMQRVLRDRWEAAGRPLSSWVFPCKRFKSGKLQSPTGHITTVEKQFLKARASAGLAEDVVLYTARHTFGTRAYRRSGNLASVMETMGHADIGTTIRYQHQGTRPVREAIENYADDTIPDTVQ